MTKDNISRLEFTAIPHIADNPKYGWVIISKTIFRSQLKANKAIKRIKNKCLCTCHFKWNADLCDECQHKHGLPRFQYGVN